MDIYTKNFAKSQLGLAIDILIIKLV